ncbi:NAD-dependent epimerase/dehydratase family protein [Patescibacteria group bacterium]|nr:MAG: NAD-dependent epimerase/dehydratase family protein [Patescibacteria group bacterium]
MARILITGGAGMIGSHLADAFLSRGDSVTVMDTLVSGKREFVPGGAAFLQRDIRDPYLDFSGFDGVMHLAAEPYIPESYIRPREFFDVNAFGTLNVLFQAKKAGVKKIIFYSSSEIYGSAVTAPMDERHPTLPHSTYAVSKLAADRLAWTLWYEHQIPVVIQRQFNVYGPRSMQPYVIPEIIKQLQSGRTAVRLGNIEARRDFTYVSDATRATTLLWERGLPGEVYNVGTGVARTVGSIARDIGRLMGREITVELDAERLRPLDVNHLEADAGKIRSLGWSPLVGWEDGLRQMIAWHGENSHHFSPVRPSGLPVFV